MLRTCWTSCTRGRTAEHGGEERVQDALPGQQGRVGQQLLRDRPRQAHGPHLQHGVLLRRARSGAPQRALHCSAVVPTRRGEAAAARPLQGGSRREPGAHRALPQTGTPRAVATGKGHLGMRILTAAWTLAETRGGAGRGGAGAAPSSRRQTPAPAPCRSASSRRRAQCR